MNLKLGAARTGGFMVASGVAVLATRVLFLPFVQIFAHFMYLDNYFPSIVNYTINHMPKILDCGP